MITLDALSTILAWITGMIILCHQRKVQIELIISSNCKKNHPSIKNIKAKLNSVRSFSFQQVFMDEVKKDIRDLKNNKSKRGEIPIQILKEGEFIFKILTNCINKSLEIGCFPDNLKEANITPIFKKDDLFEI